MVLSRLLGRLNSREIKPVNPKGNQPWIFTGRPDAEVEAPVLWPPDVKSQLTGKDPDAGKDWRQKEKGTAEDEMVGWHHWLDGHEFEQAWGIGDGQGSLMCYSPWGLKESNMTEWLNWTELKAFDCVDHNKLRKILQEMGIPDHLISLLRNLYAGQEATVRNGHGTMDSFQIRKGGRQGCLLSPCLFNFYAEYIQ